MSKFEHPTKEVVRAWLKREVERHRPPPDIKQIRRELGWNLVQPPKTSDRDAQE